MISKWKVRIQFNLFLFLIKGIIFYEFPLIQANYWFQLTKRIIIILKKVYFHPNFRSQLLDVTWLISYRHLGWFKAVGSMISWSMTSKNFHVTLWTTIMVMCGSNNLKNRLLYRVFFFKSAPLKFLLTPSIFNFLSFWKLLWKAN